MEKANETVVFILLKEDQVLMEERAADSTFAGLKIFPAGKIENENIDEALIRELREELGILPLSYLRIPVAEEIYGETGRHLIPYLITEWEGEIPNFVLDKGNTLLWEDLQQALITAPLKSSRKLAQALVDHLSNPQL